MALREIKTGKLICPDCGGSCPCCGFSTDDTITIDRELFEEVLQIAEHSTKVAYDEYLVAHDGFTKDSIIESFEDDLDTIKTARNSIK